MQLVYCAITCVILPLFFSVDKSIVNFCRIIFLHFREQRWGSRGWLSDDRSLIYISDYILFFKHNLENYVEDVVEYRIDQTLGKI